MDKFKDAALENFNATTVTGMLTQSVILTRQSDGSIETNVPSQKVVHSPDGFEYGCEGNGSADLALNILLFAGLDETEAVKWYPDYKMEVISKLDREKTYILAVEEILCWHNSKVWREK